MSCSWIFDRQIKRPSCPFISPDTGITSIFLLLARRSDELPKVAKLIKKSNRCERNPQITRARHDISRQHPHSAGVYRERRNRKFSRKVGGPFILEFRQMF